MQRKTSRRDFLRQTTAAGVGFWIVSRPLFGQSRSPNEKLQIGVVGVGGQGEHDLNQMTAESIVALCDVDERRAGGMRERFPKAPFYSDFRKMLEQKDIDAVLVATPDHTHAVATMAALKAGKHVYCEKPLTHTIWEAQVVMETARKMKAVTQMGTQIHAGNNYRRVVELIRTGAIGTVEEVHVWVDRQWAGGDRPTDTPAIPEGLHYDLWLGPAPQRPYHPAYVPGDWRGWWDFGGGTLGDMGCHYMDLPHWALNLTWPTKVEAEGPAVHPESTPKWLIVRYEYPRRGQQPPVHLTWYNGGKRPTLFAEGKLPEWKGDGVAFVGSDGILICDYDRYQLLPAEQFKDFKPPEPFIANSVAGHYREWIEACKNGGRPLCNFDYAVPLTQTVLLGNVAYRSGQKLEWDGQQQAILNSREAMKFLQTPYRDGWSL